MNGNGCLESEGARCAQTKSIVRRELVPSQRFSKFPPKVFHTQVYRPEYSNFNGLSSQITQTILEIKTSMYIV